MQNGSRSGVWNFLAVLALIGAGWYAWPGVLEAIEKGAYAGAEAGAKAAVREAIKEAKAEVKATIDEALPTWAK